MAVRHSAPKARPVAVALVRASTDAQDQSTADQEQAIRSWCEDEGYELARVFSDDGVSGANLKRPGLLSLMSYVEERPAGGTVVLWRRNRLARAQDPLDGLLLERRIEKAGWRLHVLHGRQATGDAFMDRLLGLVEHHQAGEFLRSLAVDTLRGQLRSALGGGMLVGVAPYGFQRRVEAADGRTRNVPRGQRFRRADGERVTLVAGEPSEVEVVNRIFTDYASERLSAAGLAKTLNAGGIPSPRQKTWSQSTIRAMLRNPAYAGTYVWNRSSSAKLARILGQKVCKQKAETAGEKNSEEDVIPIENFHEALVSKEVFDRVQSLLARRGGRNSGKRYATRSYPLSGLVTCQACGSPMTVTRFDARGPVYVCKGYRTGRTCEAYMVKTAKLEAEVLRSLQEVLLPLRRRLRPKLIKLLKQRLGGSEIPGLDRLKREAATLERKVDGGLERLVLLSGAAAERLAEKIQGWTERQAEVAAEIAAAETRSQGLPDVEALADEILGLLEGLADTGPDAPPDELRVLFQRLVRGVELDFVSVPPKTGKRMRRKLRSGRVALPEPLVAAASVLPQRNKVVSLAG
jgi:DNA invertase Pin-like site-specific DNA recombinase